MHFTLFFEVDTKIHFLGIFWICFLPLLINMYSAHISTALQDIPISSLSSFPLGTLSDRLGRRNIMSAGFIVFGIVYFGFAWVQESIYIWLLLIFYGLYEALTEGIGKAYVVDLVPSDKRGTALGIYHGASGFMMLFASIIAGLLWDILGPSAPFIYGGAAAVLSALLLIVLMPGDHRLSQVAGVDL